MAPTPATIYADKESRFFVARCAVFSGTLPRDRPSAFVTSTRLRVTRMPMWANRQIWTISYMHYTPLPDDHGSPYPSGILTEIVKKTREMPIHFLAAQVCTRDLGCSFSSHNAPPPTTCRAGF